MITYPETGHQNRNLYFEAPSDGGFVGEGIIWSTDPDVRFLEF